MIERIAYIDVLARMLRKLGQERYTLHHMESLASGKVRAQFRPIP